MESISRVWLEVTDDFSTLVRLRSSKSSEACDTFHVGNPASQIATMDAQHLTIESTLSRTGMYSFSQRAGDLSRTPYNTITAAGSIMHSGRGCLEAMPKNLKHIAYKISTLHLGFHRA